jgi:hypothetical protein
MKPRPSRLTETERAQLGFAMGTGIMSACTFAGTIMLAQVLGFLPMEDSPGMGARVFAGLVGLFLVFGSLALGTAVLHEITAAEGLRGPLRVMGVAGARFLSRVTRGSLVSAVLLAPLAWSYWSATHSGRTAWGPTPQSLEELVAIEFLVIHGFPFLAFSATPIRSAERFGRRLGWALVLGFGGLYSLFAWDVAGPWGIVGLCYLMLPNVLAFARSENNWAVRTTAAARWGVQFILFFGIAVMLDQTSLRGPKNLGVGLYYFASQVLVELFRVAELPLDLGAAWARVPQSRRRARTWFVES